VIDDPLPQSWKDLQDGVARIFTNLGLIADTEVTVATPRGSVTLDVLALDSASLDNIKYVVECKNWGAAIPQSVVHSFTTVMHETGANIGFIISRVGLQSGAEKYTESTNISGLTYLEFQQRYFNSWWYRYFCPLVGDAADKPLQFIEPINSARDTAYNDLSAEKKAEFDALRERNGILVMMLSMLNIGFIAPHLVRGDFQRPPPSIEAFKLSVASVAPHVTLSAASYRGIMHELIDYLQDLSVQFDAVLGFELFPGDLSLTGVTLTGPPGNRPRR